MKKLSLLVLATLAQSALAQEKPQTTLQECIIQQPLPGKNMTGAFLKFHHQGADVMIQHAEIPTITPVVELHSMEMKDNVMSMIPLTDYTLKAGERVFKKGADHLMLMQIPDDKLPKAGEKHKITVFFGENPNDPNAYSAECEAEIKTVEEIIEAQGGDAHAHHAHGHHHAPTSKK